MDRVGRKKKNAQEKMVSKYEKITTRKAINGVFKHPHLLSSILILTEIYRFKFVQFLLIFGLKNCGHVFGLPQIRYPHSFYLPLQLCANFSFTRPVVLGFYAN